MLRNHNESEFSCETCPKSFKTKLNLKLHLRTHDTPKNFKCDKVVQTRTALWKHVKTKHDNLKYKCSYCSSTFTSKSHCQVHEGKCSQCFQCEKSFKNKTHLENYMKLYEITECDICSKTFSNRNSMEVHKRCIGSLMELSAQRNKYSSNQRDTLMF